MEWKGLAIRPGDTYTITGGYVRRTFWQWLTRQPRCLRIYTYRERD